MAYDNRNFIQKLFKMPTREEKQAAREATPEYQAINTAGMTLTIKDRAKNADQLAKAQKIGRILFLVLVYAFLAFMAVIVLFPFYWMIITSLKSTTEIRALQQTFFPTNVLWSNYITVFNSFDFGTYVGNTLVVGIISTLGTLLTTIFSAFAFARLNFKGREALFGILLATMMIPGEMMVITNYITVSRLPWYEFGVGVVDGWLQYKDAVFASMIVPFWVSVFYIYLLRQNFKQIPNELYLAAKVDGKSDWQYLWKVMVPLASPTLISIFILKLMGTWNSYVWPNLVTTNNEEWRLVTNALRGSFTNSSGEPQYGIQMAATILVTTPLLLLFIFFRKYIMRGVGRAGIKG
ncbi:MAG: carbohydrate ABC transporter permease [Bacillales bacterium]|nr:carbohydrate ABC transporter permease [Bacillales bacterium]MDY5919569.1 carbohydrate ABC transporter permease [Candidatus Enteromonas sp.]